MNPVRAWIGLGANLGEPLAQLRSAIRALRALPATTVEAVSPLYGSAPIGPADQPDYLNAVARLRTGLTPHALLRELQAIEQAHGRVRQRHWGERTLDLDLLLYGNDQIDTAELKVPHPEMSRRAFVLLPLIDLNPDLIMPDGLAMAAFVDVVRDQDLHQLMAQEWWQAIDSPPGKLDY